MKFEETTQGTLSNIFKAIARAIYANKAILLLDDVFSGLDKGTAKIVFSRLFGSRGVVRASHSTVVMTTNLCKFSMTLFHIF